MKLNIFLAVASVCLFIATALPARAQSADWQEVIWREPQVRYLLADMTGGGKVEMYRKYATEERDADSREAIRLWDAGVRVLNMADFERGWITNKLAKDGRAIRVGVRGTSRTITGDEILLSNDGVFSQPAMRLALLDFTLGAAVADYEKRKSDPAIAGAPRRWQAGGHASNSHVFAAQGEDKSRQLVFRGSNLPADGARVKLNSDVSYPEVNVRYFMADVALGGSLEFYRKVAEDAHEMGYLEAVRRVDEGYKARP